MQVLTHGCGPDSDSDYLAKAPGACVNAIVREVCEVVTEYHEEVDVETEEYDVGEERNKG